MKLNQLKTSCWVAVLLLPLSIAPAIAQNPVRLVVADRLQPAPSVRMSGYLGEKLDASYENRVLA